MTSSERVTEHPTSLRLDPDVREALKLEARKQGCSLGFKINQILREWMEKLEK